MAEGENKTGLPEPGPSSSDNIKAAEDILKRLIEKGPRRIPAKTEDEKLSAADLSERLRRDREALAKFQEESRKLREGFGK